MVMGIINILIYYWFSDDLGSDVVHPGERLDKLHRVAEPVLPKSASRYQTPGSTPGRATNRVRRSQHAEATVFVQRSQHAEATVFVQPADVVAAQGVHAAHHHETDVYVCGARCIPRETGPAPARLRVCGAPGPHGEGLRSRRKRVKKGGGGRVAGTRPGPRRRQNGTEPGAPGPAGDRAARCLPVVIACAPSKVPYCLRGETSVMILFSILLTLSPDLNRDRLNTGHPPRSLLRDGQTSPHRPRLVVSRSTCPPLFPPPTRTAYCSNKHTRVTVFKFSQAGKFSGDHDRERERA
jgi:hypothetical protein